MTPYIILSLLTVISLFRNDPIFAFMTFSFLIILAVFPKLKLIHPIFFFLLPSLAILFVAGSVFNLYEQPTIYDKAVHLYGSFIVTFLFGSYIQNFYKIKKFNITLAVAVILLGFLTGIVWEAFEFYVGGVIQENLLESSTDVIGDIFVDFVGVIIGACFLPRLKLLKT